MVAIGRLLLVAGALAWPGCAIVGAQAPGATERASLDTARIERLTVELQSLGYEQINQIWAFIGGKHLPSAIYKVRMVALQDTAPSGVEQPLTEIRTTFVAP